MSSYGRYQFSLRSIFIVTTLLAVLLAILRTLGIPIVPALLVVGGYVGVVLVMVLIYSTATTRKSSPQSPCPIASFRSELQAEAAAGALQAEGIRTVTIGGFTSGFRAEAPGEVQVVVAEQDVARAMEILKEFDNGTDDWHGDSPSDGPAED